MSILDRGGNRVTSDASTLVAASLLSPSPTLSDVAGTGGGGAPRFFSMDGTGYVLRTSGGDAQVHKRPYVGVSQVRSWSRWCGFGAILWAFVAKT